MTEQFNRIQRRRTVRQNQRLAQGRLNIDFSRLKQLVQQIFFTDIAQRLIYTCLTDNQQTAIRRIFQLRILLFPTLGNIQFLDFPTRNHHTHNRTLRQSQHAANHGFFVFFKMLVIAAVIACFCQNAFADTHHTQHIFSGALTPRSADVVIFAGILLRNLIKQFDQNREADRRIQIAFRNMEMEGFRNQAETNHQQETQTQHHDGRMLVDKSSQRFAGGNHHRHRHNNRTHCHHNMIHHRHCRNNRIDRENRIQNQDLCHNAPKSGMLLLPFSNSKLIVAFKAFVQLSSRFIKQENTAGKHNHIFTGNLQAAQLKQRTRQRHDVRHKAQHENPNNDSQTQARYPRPIPLRRFDLVCQNRYENKVINT